MAMKIVGTSGTSAGTVTTELGLDQDERSYLQKRPNHPFQSQYSRR